MQIFQKIKITLQGCSDTNRNISLHSIAQILDFSSVRNLKLTMVYSKEQKIKIVEWWFETKCYTTVRRRYAREFNVRYVRAPQQKFIQKFMTKGTVLDCRKEKAGAPITARSPANVDRVRASVQQSPKKSLRHRSQELGISVTSLQRMLRKDLNKFPCKISIHTKPKEITMVPAGWCNSPYSTRDYGPFAHIVWKQNLEFAGRARMISA